MKTFVTSRKEAIISLTREWLENPKLKKSLVDALEADTGFPEMMAEEILDTIFKKLDKSSRTPATHWWGKTRGVIVPGNVPDPLISEVMANLATGYGVYVKLSGRMRIFGETFLKSIESHSRYFQGRVNWTFSLKEFLEKSRNFDVVTAFGSDESIRQLRFELPESVDFRGHGQHMSAGIIFRSALTELHFNRTVSRCALDTWLYDQRGCLSPQIFFVEDNPKEFCIALQKKLIGFQKRFGVIERPFENALERRVFLDRLVAESLEYGRVILPGNMKGNNPVVYVLQERPFTPGPGGQVVALSAFGELPHIESELKPHAKKIHAISVAGTETQMNQVAKYFESWRIKYLCPVGRIQDPPLGFENRRITVDA